MPPLYISGGSFREIRPCQPLEASPAGFLAYLRNASSKRDGLLWTSPPTSSSPSISSLSEDSRDITNVSGDLPSITDLIPAIAYRMIIKEQARRVRGIGLGEAEMKDVLRGLGKHSWNLESYVCPLFKSSNESS